MRQQASVLMSVTLLSLASLLAAAQTPTAAPATAPSDKVVRWQSGGVIEKVGDDQMKVLIAGDIKVAVTLVDLWKETTAARLQLTNTSQTAVATDPVAFSLQVVKPKDESLTPVAPEKLRKKITAQAESDAQGADAPTFDRSVNMNSAGSTEATRSRLGAEAWSKTKYIKESAFPASVEPRFQTIGHIYFPYLKKRDSVVLRMKLGDTTFEFPFEKSEIRAALR